MMGIINTVYITSAISEILYHTLNYSVLLTQGYYLLLYLNYNQNFLITVGLCNNGKPIS